MLKNYIVIALRNLVKYKAFSLINVLGLTVGLTCCLLILIFVTDEYSYDKFHQKGDRIYRVQYMIRNVNIGSIPPIMGEHVGPYFPEIERAGRMYNRSISVRVESSPQAAPSRYEEENVFFTDPSILDIFTFQVVEGSLNGALNEPYSLIINEQIAHKYFGTTNVVGKQVVIEGDHTFKVVAVVKDFPSNSHLHFNMLVPYDNMYDVEPESLRAIVRNNYQRNWMISHSMTYILLKEGASPEAVNDRFADFISEKIPEGMQKGQSFKLQPLNDIHLNPAVAAQADPPGDVTFIYIFIAVGALTLLIASINFINLSTARSLQRTKEIGMRKVLGAWKSNLITQFLGETFVTTGVAMLISLVATATLLPQLNALTSKSLTSEVLMSPIIVAGAAGLLLLTALLAGLYPSFFVSRISPIYSLKGQLSSERNRGSSLRKGLIIGQFTISMVLISCALIVFDQLDLLQNKPLGFQKEHMINVPIQSQNFNNFFGGVDGEKRRKMNAFEQELEQVPGVLGSTVSASAPGSGVVNRNVIPEGYTAEDNVIAPVYSVDYDFIDVYGISLLEGRTFSRDFGTDHLNAFVINQYAVNEYKFDSPLMAIGKEINVEGKQGKVVGVVDDFNFLPLNNPMGPLIMEVAAGSFTTFSIKIDNRNIPETLSRIEETWNNFFPHETFASTFLDEQIERNYASQQQLGQVVSYFSILAIIISCLGSYGLIMFVAQQKMKEVGIRKVLGASMGQLVLLLSKHFILLAMVATVLSVPLGIWIGEYWLENFSYRIDISPFNFVLSCLITFGLVLITISVQSVKTAIANPVKALRNE